MDKPRKSTANLVDGQPRIWWAGDLLTILPSPALDEKESCVGAGEDKDGINTDAQSNHSEYFPVPVLWVFKIGSCPFRGRLRCLILEG